MRKKKSNTGFGIGVVIIVVLLLQLVKACNRNDWLSPSKQKNYNLNSKDNNMPKWFKPLVDKAIKEKSKKN